MQTAIERLKKQKYYDSGKKKKGYPKNTDSCE
jgi:hypothetical protein